MPETYTPASSSWVESVEYGHEILTIHPKKGRVYRYSPVPVAVWEELKAAPSVGSFLSKRILGVYSRLAEA